MMQKFTPVVALLAIFCGIAYSYDIATAFVAVGGLIWIDLTIEGISSRNGDQ
jgi:uncharacterized membrane protein YfbV (UPF0208 family)